MEILQELGDIIRSRRKAKGLSQEKLAELADVHRTYIGAVERGEQNICFVNLCRIAASLSVPLSEMLEPLDKSVISRYYREEYAFFLAGKNKKTEPVKAKVEVRRNKRSFEM